MIRRVIILVLGVWSILVMDRAAAQEAAGRTEGSTIAGRTDWHAEGMQGAVSAGGRDAVAAGLGILKSGGNAADAAAATILALSVTDSRLFCFGGEVPILIYDAKAKAVTVIAGQGAAPTGDPSTFQRHRRHSRQRDRGGGRSSGPRCVPDSARSLWHDDLLAGDRPYSGFVATAGTAGSVACRFRTDPRNTG